MQLAPEAAGPSFLPGGSDRFRKRLGGTAMAVGIGMEGIEPDAAVLCAPPHGGEEVDGREARMAGARHRQVDSTL